MFLKIPQKTLFKKRLRHRCFPVNFAKCLRTRLFFVKQLRWQLLETAFALVELLFIQSKLFYDWITCTVVVLLDYCLSEQDVVFTKTKSSRQEVFCKNGVLKNFEKFIGKHLCGISFNEVTGVISIPLENIRKLKVFWRFKGV